VAAEPHTEAIALFQAGRISEAAALLESTCARDPSDARAWFLLGACRHALRNLEPALAAFDRAIALDPSNLQAAQAAIAVLCEVRRPAEALARCENLLSRHPGDPQLQFSTGIVREALGDFAGALARYDRALALDPGFVHALQNRGIALTRLGRIDEAVENNRKFASLWPQSVDAHYNLAEACLAARRYDDAVLAAREALAIDAGHALSRLDLGLALAASGQIEEARGQLEQALSRNDPAVYQRIEDWAAASGAVAPFDVEVVLQPEEIFLTMGCERLERCDWTGLHAFIGRAAEIATIPRPHTRALAFKLLYLPLPAPAQRMVADGVAALMSRLASSAPALTRPLRPRSARLRIAYVSSGFGRHATGYLTRSIYALHDHERFEIFGFSLAPDDGSDVFRSIAKDCDHFTVLHAFPAGQIAGQIAQDAIDVLVDLNGYMRDNRSEVLALRPAPVQVSYLGYPATLGGSLADYLIADAEIAPEGSATFYAERLVRLPHTYFATSYGAVPRLFTPKRIEEALPEDGLVFCAFHRHEKIEPAIFSSWMRILHAVPVSVLWLLQGPGEANLRRHATDAGIDPARLIFARRRDLPEHLARQRLADLYLDAHTCNAHTSAADALWSGVPVVTFPGEHFVSRVGASLLRAIGLDSLIARSFEEYEAMAIDLALHPETLNALKSKLAQNRETYPLFDTERLVRNLERAYLQMWRIHESGAPPRAFDVEEP
jgi:predicted O-linked N-acetylglucosamine transferase (SPINDLY family)